MDWGEYFATVGVQSFHYDQVGNTLLWTIEMGLGEAWSLESAEAWTQVYGLVADAMKAGAARLSA